jgi:hypothetical protein
MTPSPNINSPIIAVAASRKYYSKILAKSSRQMLQGWQSENYRECKSDFDSLAMFVGMSHISINSI